MHWTFDLPDDGELDDYIHLTVGRYTWCTKTWADDCRKDGKSLRTVPMEKRTNGRLEQDPTCPDCLAALAAVRLERMT